MVCQEVSNYWLQWLPSGQIGLAQCFVKYWVLHEFSDLMPSNMPTLSFSMLIRCNFSRRKANPQPSLSIGFPNFFITPNLICRDGSIILFGSTGEWDWTLWEQSFNPCLNGHSCLTICWSSGWPSQRQRKQGYFMYPPWSPMTSPTTKDLHRSTILCSKYLIADSKWSVLSWVSFIWTDCPIGIDEKIFPLSRTALRFLLDESIKSFHSIVSYPLIWSIQQCYCNKSMMTYPGTWKTVLIFSHSPDTSRTGTNRCFSLRCEPSSWTDSFERFRSRVKSLSSVCVKGSGWSSSSNFYTSSPATTVMWLCSESELYSMLLSGSGTGRSRPWRISLMAEGTSRYWT